MIAIFPELATCAGLRDIERLTILVRHYFGGDKRGAPCCDVEEIIGRVGIQSRVLPLQDVAALVAKDEAGAFEIAAVQAENPDPKATRFIWAHLLGHYFIHIQPQIARGELRIGGYRELRCPMGRFVGGGQDGQLSAAEREAEDVADEFAAALLLPKAMLLRAMEKVGNESRVADFFGVTKGVLRRRLELLARADSAPTNFLAAEDRITIRPRSRSQSPSQNHREMGQDALQVQDSRLPRSYAAKSYGDTARSTEQRPNQQPNTKPQSPEPKVNLKPKPVANVTTKATASMPPQAAPQKGDSKDSPGLQKLRQLARQIDPSVDP